MPCSIIFSVLNAKFVHASPAPWCLAAGVRAYAPEFYPSVQIVEATINQPVDTVLAEILCKAPSLIGFSCYIWNIQETIVLCEKLKQALPDLVIVLGGPEVSFCPTEILEAHTQVDYILKGEGEESVPAFLKALFSSKQGPTACDSSLETVPGLCRRLSSGKIEENDGTPLAYLPPSPLTVGYPEALNGRIAYFETSRGCPYACAFCLSGRNDPLRVFPLEESVSYLLRLAQSQTQTVKFVDRTFNANVRHCNGILTFILLNYGKSIPRGIRFHFEMAGDILQEETFELLRQMPPGAVQLEIGMQSFHEKTLVTVHRKTDTQVLKNNVRRLVEMRNLHIHIDLIAGLPYEDLSAFTESFNTAYSLCAQMLQLGFLKLLHGSLMRVQKGQYPCVFDETPPYQVRETPWLSSKDMTLLHDTADALERTYNSGRFSLTLSYVLNQSGLSPFTFFSELGMMIKRSDSGAQTSLDTYTDLLQKFCVSLPGIDPLLLRDYLVQDRLTTNSSGRLPPCLFHSDVRFKKALTRLSANEDTAPMRGVKRSVALLYTFRTICYVDYLPGLKDPVTGRWKCREIPFDDLL